MKKNIVKSILCFLITISLIAGVGIGIRVFKSSEEAFQVISERVLVPGGQSVGIKMNVKGVLIVGLEEIETEDGIMSPGYEAGLQIGDMVTKIDGNPVSYASEVSAYVNKESNKKVTLTILRKEKTQEIIVKPVKDYISKEYKLGLWVKEKIAGIGTLTFYDPKTKIIATLGHGIYESQTGTLLETKDGELLQTQVNSIKEGTVGNPGEIRGVICDGQQSFGQVKRNSIYGVYATMLKTDIFQNAKPMVMATQDQIQVGEAYILTTINGDTVEPFEIQITKVNHQKSPDIKSMEIQVTDEKLLSHSGGIVQGMSGSPIIQNNRLVGAVTHVLVSDPTRGYGVFVEWMINEGEQIK